MADLLAWADNGADNDMNVPGNFNVGYAGAPAASIDTDDNLKFTDDESAANATASANLEAGSIDLAPAAKTAYSGVVNDGGNELKFNGDILIPDTADRVTSTGKWIQNANGSIKNQQVSNVFAEIEFVAGITSTWIEAIRAKKFTIGNCTLAGSYRGRVSVPSNDFLSIHSSAIVAPSFTAYVNSPLTHGALNCAGFTGGFTKAGGATLTLTGHWYLPNCTITGIIDGFDFGTVDVTVENIYVGSGAVKGDLVCGASGIIITGNFGRNGTTLTNTIDFGGKSITLSDTFDGTGISVTGNGNVITGGTIQNVTANKKDAINAKASTSGGNNLGVVFVDILQPSLMAF